MKRLVLFVVALVFAFSTTVMAADKPAAVAAEKKAEKIRLNTIPNKFHHIDKVKSVY